jgi:phage shock protein C
MINFLGFSMVFALSLIFGIITLGIWIWAIIDCIKSKKETNEKILWIIILFLFNIIGAIIYFLMKEHKGKGKRLEKSDENKVIAGVCGGIGEYFNIDPTIIRLVWVLLTIFSIGTGLLLYLISALIIPHRKKTEKKENKASGFVIITITIAVILVFLILSGLMITIIAMERFGTGTTVTHRITERQVMSESEEAERFIKSHIRSHENYINNNGNSLSCISIIEIDPEICTVNNDPYGVRVYTNKCYRIRCKYNAEHDYGYIVEAVVYHNSIKNISFTEISLPEKTLMPINTGQEKKRQIISDNSSSTKNGIANNTKQEILTESDCRDKGYEVVYPELKGGPIQCVTDKGTISIATDSLCEDVCGDGICQEIVCLGQGCPCAETMTTCPKDCNP